MVTEEVPDKERSRQGSDEESMGVELVIELHCVDDGTVNLYVVSVDCKHVVRVVSLVVEV